MCIDGLSWRVSIGLDKVLAPHRLQAIIVTNADLVNWETDVSPGLVLKKKKIATGII